MQDKTFAILKFITDKGVLRILHGLIAEMNAKELEDESFDREMYRRYIITKMEYQLQLKHERALAMLEEQQRRLLEEEQEEGEIREEDDSPASQQEQNQFSPTDDDQPGNTLVPAQLEQGKSKNKGVSDNQPIEIVVHSIQGSTITNEKKDSTEQPSVNRNGPTDFALQDTIGR